MTQKSGKKGDKPWTRYTVLFADGRSGVTFSASLAKEAEERVGAPCRPDLLVGEKGTDFRGWLPAPDVQTEPAGVTPAAHTDEPVDGPEQVLTVREAKTDKGSRWIIQTSKRQLISDQEAHATAAIEARKQKLGVVPSFEVVKTQSGSANRLTGLVVETVERQPGEEG